MKRFTLRLIPLLILCFVLVSSPKINIVKASGTVYIRSDGRIFPSDAPISRDGNIYTLTDDINDSIVIQKDDIVLDGLGFYAVEGLDDYDSIGIDLTERSNVTIKNLEIKAFGYGILLNTSSNIILSGNTLKENNAGGISLSNSSNNSIRENQFSANVNYDVDLWYSSNNTICENNARRILIKSDSNNNRIYGNQISGSGQEGIGLFWSANYNSIYENNITANGIYGIHIGHSSNLRIYRNNITYALYGIDMDSSSNNFIVGNKIKNNSIGILLDSSSENTIFHNNFIENYVRQALTTHDSLLNLWDDGYPSGGNYWSNYTGIDPNNDGIGDSDHVLDENNKDNFPLMGPINFFDAGTWNSKTYFVDVVSNSTVSDFHFDPSEPVKHFSFNVTGSDGIGFCRVVFSMTLLQGQYTVTVNDATVITNDASNTTHAFLYFDYNHSTQIVKVIGTDAIPEFPSFMILPLFMIATLLAVIFYRRKYPM